jgi:hypothetical protein
VGGVGGGIILPERIESNWGLIADFLLPYSLFVRPKARGRIVCAMMGFVV